jgi:hypothetical protein
MFWTEWPDEFVKRCSPTHFCQNYYVTITVHNSSRKFWATLIISKTAQSKQSPIRQKFAQAQSGHPGFGKQMACEDHEWYFLICISFYVQPVKP